VKLNGFVASAPDFIEQHLVINVASNLIAGVLGEAGKHALAAVGMAALPLNAAVEIDAIMEIAE
ncbi:RidA family protein, partial [Rhizobium ruizarguesonis]